MPKRAFHLSVAISLAVFGVFNIAVARMSRHTIPRQVARRIDEMPVLNCLALGNSLMQAGFDETAFEAASAQPGRVVKSVNAGLGSSSPVEHLLLARRAYRGHRTLDNVFYGFFDFQLTVLPRTAPPDLIGNRAMLYYFEPSIVPGYYAWSWPDRLSFHAMRFFPALVERGVIWEKLELVRRRMAKIGMPAERTNRFGNVTDFELLESDSAAAFEGECERQIANHVEFARPIADMIRLAKERGSHITMVEMPMHPYHQRRFYQTAEWQRYRAYLRNISEREGAGYIEASEWLQDEESFSDHLHASPSGAAVFSRRLAGSATGALYAWKP
jgi:hypothetical protein